MKSTSAVFGCCRSRRPFSTAILTGTYQSRFLFMVKPKPLMLSTPTGPYKMIKKKTYKLKSKHLALYQTDILQLSAHSFISNINVAYR